MGYEGKQTSIYLFIHKIKIKKKMSEQTEQSVIEINAKTMSEQTEQSVIEINAKTMSEQTEQSVIEINAKTMSEQTEQSVIEINAKTMQSLSIAERAKLLTSQGIKTDENVSEIEESFLPETFEVVDIIAKTYDIDKVGIRKGLRIVVKDVNSDKITSCSKSKCTGFILENNGGFVSPEYIGSDKNGKVTLYGKQKLSVLPINNAMLFDCIGKKYTAKKVNTFIVNDAKFVNKSQALESVKASSAYIVQNHE